MSWLPSLESAALAATLQSAVRWATADAGISIDAWPARVSKCLLATLEEGAAPPTPRSTVAAGASSPAAAKAETKAAIAALGQLMTDALNQASRERAAEPLRTIAAYLLGRSMTTDASSTGVMRITVCKRAAGRSACASKGGGGLLGGRGRGVRGCATRARTDHARTYRAGARNDRDDLGTRQRNGSDACARMEAERSGGRHQHPIHASTAFVLQE